MTFTVTKETNRVVFTFPDVVVVDPTSEEEQQILELGSRYAVVAFDISTTRAIPTSWLRLFWHVTNNAKSAPDKKILVVGIKPEVERKADLIALKAALKFVPRLEDAK